MVDIMAVPGLEAKTSNAFRWELIQLSERRNLNPDFVAAVMALETGRTFRPDIENPASKALGLLQFMPFHFSDTNTKALFYPLKREEAKAMTQIEQLSLVEKYFEKVAPKGLTSICNHYLAVFSAYWMGKPESTVVAIKDSEEPYIPGSNVTKGKVYEQNKGFDTSGKGFYTVADICGVINQFKSGKRLEVQPEDSPMTSPKDLILDQDLSLEEWLSLLALSMLHDAEKGKLVFLGNEATKIVKRYQKIKNLKVDGIIGKFTLRTLV